MKTLDFAIGKKLPLDILMQPVFLGGGRGSGKTSGAKTLYEAAHDADAQCIAIAPTGKWWSLRLGADGKSAGLDDVFVFGGPHGDLPLLADAGATIAKLLVDKRVHAVLDVSLMRKGERARFLAAFLEEFWLLKKQENESFPVVVFIEEAHAVVPQRPQPEEARMLGAAEDLVREGRNHGIGVVLLDQRAAVVNKNVIALVEVLIVLRTIHHLDRDTYGAWIVEKGSADKSWLAQLPSQAAGEAFLYAPLLDMFDRIKMRMPRTFNATATARIGERAVKMGTLTQVDVGALRESMAQVIAEAEKNDPRALQREIARLKAELAKKPAAAAAPAKTVEVPVITPKDRAAMEGLTTQLESFYEKTSAMRMTAEDLRAKLKAALSARVDAPPKLIVPAPSERRAQAVAPVIKATGLTAKASEILGELVALHPRQLNRDDLAMRAGLRNNGNFRNYLSELRTAGMIGRNDPKDDLPTDAALKLLNGVQPKSFTQLRSQWAGLLTTKALAILDFVIEAGDRRITRDEAAAAVGLENNGNFRNYMSELNVAALIDEPRKQPMTSAPALYLGGT